MDKDKFVSEVLEAETTMYRVAKSVLLRDCDAEDAVQDAILKAYTKLSTLKNEQYFKTWLIRILINECYKRKRSQSTAIPLEEYMKVTADDSGSGLYEAIMKLPQHVRITIVLHYVEGYSVEETGKILKIPTGTVKSRLHNGRKLLKEELNNE